MQGTPDTSAPGLESRQDCARLRGVISCTSVGIHRETRRLRWRDAGRLWESEGRPPKRTRANFRPGSCN